MAMYDNGWRVNAVRYYSFYSTEIECQFYFLRKQIDKSIKIYAKFWFGSNVAQMRNYEELTKFILRACSHLISRHFFLSVSARINRIINCLKQNPILITSIIDFHLINFNTNTQIK